MKLSMKLISIIFLSSSLAFANNFVTVEALSSKSLQDTKANGVSVSINSRFLEQGSFSHTFGMGFDFVDSKAGTGNAWFAKYQLEYELIDNLRVYPLIGYTAQQLQKVPNVGTNTAHGFTYGGGVSYELYKGLGIKAEYKQTKMSDVGIYGKYDYKVSTIGLTYTY